MSGSQLSKYSKGAIAFHWIIAILVVANIGLAEFTDDMTREARGPYMDVHKAFGISILALTIARLFWRWTHPRPALPSQISSAEKLLSRIAHTLFYILLVGLPFGGWLWMSSYGAPVSIFGLFNMPVLPVEGNKFLQEALHEGHIIGGKAMLVLLILHLLAALKHQFVDNLPFIGRMWP